MRKMKIVGLFVLLMVWWLPLEALAEESKESPEKPQKELQEVWGEVERKSGELGLQKGEILTPERRELLGKEREEIKAYFRDLFARYRHYRKERNTLDQEVEKIKEFRDFLKDKEAILDKGIIESLASFFGGDVELPKEKEEELINLLGDYWFLKQIIRSYPSEVSRQEMFQRLTEGIKEKIKTKTGAALEGRLLVGGYIKKEKEERGEVVEKEEPQKIVVRRLRRPRLVERRPAYLIPPGPQDLNSWPFRPIPGPHDITKWPFRPIPRPDP